MSKKKLSLEDLLDAFADMKVADIMAFVDALKEKFGISDVSIAPAAAPVDNSAGEDKPVAEEKSTFNIMVKSYTNKVALIKVIKAMMNVGIGEAKKVVDALPGVVKENVSKEESESIAQQLKDAGAEVSVD